MAKTESEDKIFIESFDKTRQKVMITRGVPPQDLIPKRIHFDVTDFLVSMTPDVPRAASKTVSVKKQVNKLHKIMSNPLRGSYCIGISSFPSDARAKYLAQTIMNEAINHQLSNRRIFANRSLPLWHRVYGSYKDSLRDGERQEKPSMLIICNINDESSFTKIEKVRDLLEIYSDIPRIVVSGGQPPCDLFTVRLSYPMYAGFYVGPPNLVQEDV